jgi:hypothetical protein
MEFNVEPYYDDFTLNAKDNNYLKILFKPGYSVQARELTQIQSILQNQIKQLGDHIFQNGSPVIGGNLTLDNKITYLKLDETYNNEDIELDSFIGRIIVRDSDGVVQAKVMASYFPSGGVPTIMIKYLSGAEFSDGDVFKVAGTTLKAKAVDSAASGKGTIVSINDGIFYVDGYFVTVVPQTAVVGAYTQNANVKIGLEISDDVVDYVVDSTLLDPAQASFNYQAPGADRYQYNLNLSTRPLETAVDESKFFELMRVENGAITKLVRYPIYSEIEKTLARRTFDESGDYTVSPFRASIGKSSDDNKYIINIEPGKAYVKGFEFETLGTLKLEANKPRTTGIDTRDIVDIDLSTSYGNYLKFKNVTGSSSSFVDISALEVVDLHCVPVNVVNTSDRFIYQNTKIGTARVRNIQRDTTGATEFTSDFRVYFTDISVQPRTLIMNTISTGITANTINLTPYASATENAYQNTTITILPVTLSPIANVNVANVFVNSTRVNANSTVANVFYDPTTGFANVGIGTIIRVGDEVRQVVNIGVDGAGNYLLVNSAFTKTVVGSDSTTNPLQIFRQNAYSSNVTNQTRQIVRYDGTTRLAYLDRAFDENAVPVQNSVIQLNFAIKDLECFMDANGITGVVNCHANVSLQSKLINGDVEMFQPYDTGLLYRLPAPYIKRASLTNVDLNHTKFIQRSASPAGTFVINNGNGLESYESIPWSVTNSNIEDNLIVFVRAGAGTGDNATGKILNLTTANVSASGSGIQITANTLITDIDVYINIKQNDVQTSYLRQKTYRSNASFSTSPFNYPQSTGAFSADYTVTVPNIGAVSKINVSNGLIFITNTQFTRIDSGDAINLFVPDVTKVRRVLKGQGEFEANSTNYVDITDHFIVDYGQKDEIYEHAKLILKQGYPTPNAKLLVHVDFFEHTYPAGASFFSVDSYSDALYQSGEIPIYTSARGGTFFLRDCLDFRSTRRIGVADGSIQTAKIPSPDASTSVSYRYYLPRIDKLVLSKNKEFRIIEGISASAPTPPDDEEGSMTLYNIYLPPYVSNISDIRLKYFDNKRYTMKDISRIDKRLEAVEYYTALNNIESRALNDVTLYEDGTNKEKYGIIGENFKNYNIADYKNKDFNVQLKENNMSPYSVSRPHTLEVVSVSNAIENGKTVSLSYSETPAISQGVTSNKTLSVQPFLFAQFIGTMKLTPEIDYWASEELKPEVIRGPEVTTIVKEINNSVVIHEKIIEKQITVTVPAPVKNCDSVIIITPGADLPSVVPEDIEPVKKDDPPVVIPPQPIDPPPAAPPADPVAVIPPVFVPSPTYAEPPTFQEDVMVVGQDWGAATSTDTYSGQNQGWIGSTEWIPVMDMSATMGQTLVEPMPSTPVQVYDAPIVASTSTAFAGSGPMNLSLGSYDNYYAMLAYYYSDWYF